MLRLLSNLGTAAHACPRLPRAPISDSDGRCVQKTGTLSPRAGDPRVLEIPCSARGSSRASPALRCVVRLSARRSCAQCNTRAARCFKGHHGPAIARPPPAARRLSVCLFREEKNTRIASVIGFNLTGHPTDQERPCTTSLPNLAAIPLASSSGKLPRVESN